MNAAIYEARKVGKDWHIYHVASGDLVKVFRSRSGLPASSLESRALNQAAGWNERRTPRHFAV